MLVYSDHFSSLGVFKIPQGGNEDKEVELKSRMSSYSLFMNFPKLSVLNS